MTCVTKRLGLAVAAVGLTVGVAGQASADIITGSVTGPTGAVNLLPNQSVFFTNFGVAAPASIYGEVLNANAPPVVTTFTYDTNPDFPGPPPADRLIKGIINNTGAPITSFSFSLTGAATFTPQAGTSAPSVGTISTPPYVFTSVQGATTFSPTLVTFALATPLANGAQDAFYLPLNVLPTGGVFALTETVNPSAVPEPASIVSASFAGLVGLGMAWRRRRAAAASAAV